MSLDHYRAYAPFDDAQVRSLRDWQEDPDVHPVTCGPCGRGVKMAVSRDGWSCPACGWRREWAYFPMTDGSERGWRKYRDLGVALAGDEPDGTGRKPGAGGGLVGLDRYSRGAIRTMMEADRLGVRMMADGQDRDLYFRRGEGVTPDLQGRIARYAPEIIDMIEGREGAPEHTMPGTAADVKRTLVMFALASSRHWVRVQLVKPGGAGAGRAGAGK